VTQAFASLLFRRRRTLSPKALSRGGLSAKRRVSRASRNFQVSFLSVLRLLAPSLFASLCVAVSLSPLARRDIWCERTACTCLLALAGSLAEMRSALRVSPSAREKRRRDETCTESLAFGERRVSRRFSRARRACHLISW